MLAIFTGGMGKKGRAERKYSFKQFPCPSKLEVLEIIEREGRITSRQLAKIMNIPLAHAAKLNMTYWRDGLLHHVAESMKTGGRRYVFSLTNTGRGKLEYFRKERNLTGMFEKA